MHYDDQHYLRRQYKTQDNLNVRIRTHELYGTPQVDFASWVLDRVDWQGHEQVLDVGCGSGLYVEPARERSASYVAGDLSLGMLQKLERPALARVNLDAHAIPLADDEVDIILANHMLYHVSDQDRALREFVRVLKPSGRLLAATNSVSNMGELQSLGRQALTLLGAPEPEIGGPALSFNLENGGRVLGRHFAHVQRHDLPGALVFPSPEPVIAYLDSGRDRFLERLPSTLSWDDLRAAFATILADHIEKNGAFRVGKLTGVFVCSN
jgi:SAM-dependent methyltransferase